MRSLSSRQGASIAATLTVVGACGCASSKPPPPRPAEEPVTLSGESHFLEPHKLDPSSTTSSAFPMTVNGASTDQPASTGGKDPGAGGTTPYVPPPIPKVAAVVPSIAPYKYRMPLASSPFAKQTPLSSDGSGVTYSLSTKGKTFAGLALGMDAQVTFYPDKLSLFIMSFPDCAPVIAALSKKWGAIAKSDQPTWQFKDGFVAIGDRDAKPCLLTAVGGSHVVN